MSRNHWYDLHGNNLVGPRGHCGITQGPRLNEEVCRVDKQRGAWITTRLRHCLALCASCAQCRFVSFSSHWQDCSWYTSCPGWPSALQPGDAMAPHVTFEVRGVDGHLSLPVRVQDEFDTCPFESRSQYAEEMDIVERFYRHHRGGHFVEIGGLDGLKFSNTFYLNRCMGWSGLLIEANLVNYGKLLHNLVFRPNVTAVHSAVCDAPNSLANFTEGGEATAIDVDLSSESFKKEWHSGAGGVNGNSGQPGAHNTVATPCTPMSDLLRHEPSTIQLLSVDVEGAEYKVLSTVDWGARKFETVLVELDSHDPVKNRRVKRLLKGQGYSLCFKHWSNHVYRKDCRPLPPALSAA